MLLFNLACDLPEHAVNSEAYVMLLAEFTHSTQLYSYATNMPYRCYQKLMRKFVKVSQCRGAHNAEGGLYDWQRVLQATLSKLP
jgi:hypothetical protein